MFCSASYLCCFSLQQAVKTCEEQQQDEPEASPPSSTSNDESRYSVRFESTRAVREFSESEIVGPGFSSVTSSKLRPGQIVYVTHANREVQGSVLHHRPNIDQVIIQILVRQQHSFELPLAAECV